MKHRDDVRTFYSGTEDAAMAFAYRLTKARRSPGDDEPDYQGLAQALQYLCIPAAVKSLAEHRDALLGVVLHLSDMERYSRLSFLSELMRLVRVSGDMELTALVACSYVEEMANSPFVEPASYADGIDMLDLYVQDSCIRRTVRAQVALRIAQVLFRTGRSLEAMKRIRQALRLTKEPDILEQAFLLVGDIDMSRGASMRARRRYERALQSAGGIDASMQKGVVAAIRWVIAMMRFGNTIYPTTEAYEPILSSLTKSPARAVLLTSLLLEIDRWQGSSNALPSALELHGVMKKLPLRWRRCCELAMALAYCLTQHDRHSEARTYIDYVVRMTTHFQDSAGAIEALLLSARVYWAQGQFRETLATIRTIRAHLHKRRPTPMLGITLLLRAKVAFYCGALKRTVRLSLRANDLFSRDGACRESFEAVRAVASCSLWLGQPESGIEVLSLCPKTQQKLNKEPNALVPTYLVLQSLSYANQRPDEASRWHHASMEILGDDPPPKAKLLATLMEAEAYCQQGDYPKAALVMESTIDQTEKIDNGVVQALCYYQCIKAHVMNAERQKAQSYLAKARSVGPCCEEMMWKHASSAIDKQRPQLSDFKPIGAFVF